MINLLAALLPYVAVLFGMYLLHHAWIAILLYHAGIIAILVYRKPFGLWRTLFSGLKTPLLLPSLVVCLLTAPIIYFIWPWLAIADGILPEWLARYGLTGWTWLLLIPYFSIIHPVLEELHWRNMPSKKVTGLCLQDGLFAGYHVLVLFQLIDWPWLFLVFGVLAGSSFFWRWAAARLDGYALPLLTHAMADTAVIIAVWLLLRA